MTTQNSRPRARDVGLGLGSMQPGPHNAITDVPGVLVGHTTLIEGSGPLVPGKGPIRTGVSVVLPHTGNLFREKVPAAVFVLNGFGKCFGQEQIDELGVIESPIAMTGTMNVGRVVDALAQYSITVNPDVAITTSTVNTIVTECADNYLNDMQGRHVRLRPRPLGDPVGPNRVGRGGNSRCRYGHEPLRLQGRHWDVIAQAPDRTWWLHGRGNSPR